MSKTSLKLKGLSLDRLETLSTIISRGGIARAAAGDANRQSQFSRQIAELESWFGVTLLDRSTSPNCPTLEAQRIVRQVDEFLKEMDLIRESSQKSRKTVTFGAGDRMIRSYLIPWFSKHHNENMKVVFRNLTSSEIRAELLAKRLDFGILRRDRCPVGMTTHGLKPIPMCLLLPQATAAYRKKWNWTNLVGTPLVLLEGQSKLTRFLQERAMADGVELDIAIECSTLSQVIDVMKTCDIGGFLPKDMEKQFPVGFVQVPLKDLGEYTDEFVIAWSASDAEKRPELGILASKFTSR